MPFTTRDFQSLMRALERKPEWREELRRLLLTDDLLRLPEAMRELTREVRRLAEAQRRTEERLAELAGRVDSLAEAQRRTDEKLAELAGRVDSLAEAQRRTEERLAELAGRVGSLAEAQRRTEEEVRRLVRVVGVLKGESVERRYRERAASYFHPILRRIRLIDPQQLGLMLEEAQDGGRITQEERADVLEADVVTGGTREGKEAYLVAEVSGVITAHDVLRARRRAAVLEKALGHPAYPVVAGESLADDPDTQREAASVWKVLDGKVSPPQSSQPR